MLGNVFSGEESQPRAEMAVAPFLQDIKLPVNRDALIQLQKSDTSLKCCFDAVVINSDNPFKNKSAGKKLFL